jgi:4-amino-4-deoxy-L-arabinose transferase-like glycosyltransferase
MPEIPSEQLRGWRILLPRWSVWLTLAFILCAVAFVRLRLLDFPLSRDEGEYAYAGQLMLQGIPPYKLAYNMKLPGTYAAYAAIMAVFGETIGGIHIGLILVNGITILFVYFLGRRLFGPICGLVAAGCFGLLSLSDSVLGLAAHATHFVTLFAVAGTLLLLKAIENNRSLTFLWCGLLFGFAFLMKQTGVFFGLFGGLFLVWSELGQRPVNWSSSTRRLGLFCAGVLLPFAATCWFLAHAAVFNRFWFWTFTYARQYVTIQSLSDGWLAFKSGALPIVHAAPGILLLAAFGITFALSVAAKRRATLFALAFSAASFATVCPGLYFRKNYFITLLPAVGLFVGAGVQIICEEIAYRRHSKFWLAVPLSVFLLASEQTVFRHRALFFSLSPNDAARAVYGLNPYPESLEIARYIREHSRPDSRVAVIGSEPQIYFYSGRHSATGYIYTYGLMEPHKYALTMQREMIAEIEAAAPEFVVFVHVSSSWLDQKDSNPLIFDWADRYTQAKLRAVGLVDFESLQRTVYRWNEKGLAAVPRSNYFISIFKRSDLF